MAHTVWNTAELVWWKTGNGEVIGWLLLAVVLAAIALR